MPKLIFIEFRTMCMPYMWLLQLMHPKNHMDNNESSKKKLNHQFSISFHKTLLRCDFIQTRNTSCPQVQVHLYVEPIHQLRKNINTCVCGCGTNSSNLEASTYLKLIYDAYNMQTMKVREQGQDLLIGK